MQDAQQKKDAVLRSISDSLQRQQAIFAQQCKTVHEREETIKMMQKALDQKDTALLGMELEKVWQSNILSNSQQHANALQEISNRLASIETPQTLPRGASPSSFERAVTPYLSPLFYQSVARSHSDGGAMQSGFNRTPTSQVQGDCTEAAADADRTVGISAHCAESMPTGAGDSADSSYSEEEGNDNENEDVNGVSASLQSTLPSKAGRLALGVLHEVENVMSPDGESHVNSDDEKQVEGVAPQEMEFAAAPGNTSESQELFTKLEVESARALVAEEELARARERVDDLLQQCSQLNVELEAARSQSREEVLRLKAQLANLQRQLSKKEKVSADPCTKLEFTFLWSRIRSLSACDSSTPPCFPTRHCADLCFLYSHRICGHAGFRAHAQSVHLLSM
jgi:hypothetical protein